MSLCRNTREGFLLVARNPKGKLSKNIWLRPFPVESLCPVRALQRYLNMTAEKRRTRPDTLFFSSTSSTPAAPDTLSNWVVHSLASCGISASAHSTRSAASSSAVLNGAPLDRVLAACDWSNASTFAAHYRRTTLPPTDLLAEVYKVAPLDDAAASIDGDPSVSEDQQSD